MLPTYKPTEHLPPPVDLLPTLTVNSKGCAYLSRALADKLKLEAAQRIDLYPPSGHTPFWHLDLRSVAGRTLAWYADTRPRIRGIKLPDGLILPGQLLELQLLPGEPAFAGFYPLIANAKPAHR
jgi:hypothetical protein